MLQYIVSEYFFFLDRLWQKDGGSFKFFLKKYLSSIFSLSTYSTILYFFYFRLWEKIKNIFFIKFRLNYTI